MHAAVKRKTTRCVRRLGNSKGLYTDHCGSAHKHAVLDWLFQTKTAAYPLLTAPPVRNTDSPDGWPREKAVSLISNGAGKASMSEPIRITNPECGWLARCGFRHFHRGRAARRVLGLFFKDVTKCRSMKGMPPLVQAWNVPDISGARVATCR